MADTYDIAPFISRPASPFRPVEMTSLDLMHFRALDSDFKAISIVDAYRSIIWTDKYADVGDFEVHGPINAQLVTLALNASYIFNSFTSTLMLIENPLFEYGEEEDSLTIKGNSFSSILNRRIIEVDTVILNPSNSHISSIICEVVKTAFAVTDNTSPRFWAKPGAATTSMLEVVNDAPSSASLSANTPLVFATGEKVDDVVKNLCQIAGLGYRFEYSVADKNVKFIVYEGTNRVVSGIDRLIFSDQYDNLVTAKDEINTASVKNTIRVKGSKEGSSETQLITSNTLRGLDRRETFIQVEINGDITDSEGTVIDTMSDQEYTDALRAAGVDTLKSKDNGIQRAYEGAIRETTNCRYAEHFSLGDIVGFRLPHAQFTAARLEGVTLSDDSETGKTFAPEFGYFMPETNTVLQNSASTSGYFNATFDTFEAWTFTGDYVELRLFCLQDSPFTINMECKFGSELVLCTVESSNDDLWTLTSGLKTDTLLPIVGEWFAIRVGPENVSCGSASVLPDKTTGTSSFYCLGDGPGGFYLDTFRTSLGDVLWDGAIGTNAWTDDGTDPHTFEEVIV